MKTLEVPKRSVYLPSMNSDSRYAKIWLAFALIVTALVSGFAGMGYGWMSGFEKGKKAGYELHADGFDMQGNSLR